MFGQLLCTAKTQQNIVFIFKISPKRGCCGLGMWEMENGVQAPAK